ncbi:MAG: nucleotide exchange factor GrpE [Rhodobiaceae bacterium]|nr:nucleotide exchange factor GrpE [Rhodobiaceae bacterium]MCC0050758.1 nucleotide exchange factor GrpE [Rhodobiaceae bacterium]MCC0061824.1 nucleotide exchange factor GrpE [Rhodobiaceae bacterium]
MSKNDAKLPGAEETEAMQDDIADAQASGPDMEAAAAAAAALAEENADLKDRLLRTVAEMENLRKRTEREVRDAGQYAIASFARDILAVADNMQRALDTAKPDDGDGAKIALDQMREGVSLTKGELVRQLERHGVKPIAAEGQKFDPNLHQAIFEIPDESVPAGTVLQVTQDGYTIGERVLRPSMVGVSRGGPKAAPAQPKVEAAAETAKGSNDNSAETAGSNDKEHIDKTV